MLDADFDILSEKGLGERFTLDPTNVLQIFCACAPDCWRYHAVHRGGRRTGPFGVWKYVQVRERMSYDEVMRSGKILLGFAGKASYDVRSER